MVIKEKIEALEKLLNQDSTTLDKIGSAVTLFKGTDARLDKKIDQVLRYLSSIRNIGEGDVVELSAENLPERTEKERKRKKAILFLLKFIKEFQSELERLQGDLSAKEKEGQSGSETLGKILAFAKGPFGIVTLAAIIAVGVFVLVKGNTRQTQTPSIQSLASTTPAPSPVPTPTPLASGRPSPLEKAKVQVISYGGRKIPLSELDARTGPDCTNSPTEAPHYHAKNGQFVRATDGTVVQDPGACAFGKVDETQVEEVEVPSSSGTDNNGNQGQGALQ